MKNSSRCFWATFLFLGFQFLGAVHVVAQETYQSGELSIHFISEAPLETIEAESTECRGILKRNTGEFAFRVPIQSFEGFNSPLQRTHFKENYMEAREYPTATFEGKILGFKDLEIGTRKTLRAKGYLNIHGLRKERLIEVEILLTEDELKFRSDFEVDVSEHEIRIPSIVKQKIAETILVHVEGKLL